ncbi:MAG TPA: CoA pyrophosphatase [Nevskiales bacterium]|nr:CoA pyrophosphatase [Nevskiales bacterium]
MRIPEGPSPAADDLRGRVIERLRPTRTAARELLRLDLPPAAAAHFSRMSLRPAAVLVPILEDSLEVLLTQRSENLRTHAGQISLPGGSCDPSDRDAVDTALREAEEEIGLLRADVEVVGLLDDYPTGTGFRVTPVVGLVSPAARPQADGIETTGLLRVPLAHVLEPAHYRAGSFVREGIELPFLEIVWGEHRIWGATAGILHNLCDKLR